MVIILGEPNFSDPYSLDPDTGFFVEFSVADPESDALLTPGSGMGKNQDPGPG